MSPQNLEALALTANFSVAALAILANCLKNNGALKPTQFEDALRETVSHPDAERARLDYLFLAQLLEYMEKLNPQDRPPNPPPLRLIQGGKTHAT